MAKSTGSEQDRPSIFSNSNGLTDLTKGNMRPNSKVTAQQNISQDIRSKLILQHQRSGRKYAHTSNIIRAPSRAATF